MQNLHAKVVFLGTGGTIAGLSAVAGDDQRYVAARLSVSQLCDAVPNEALQEIEQVGQIDSKDMGFAQWHRLAGRVAHHLCRADVAGVVIAHGTDTMEETAYFLHRLLAPSKPVVMTGAMRPADSPQADGPGNLRDAVSWARSPGAAGVVVVMNGEVFHAVDVRKVHPTRIDAFGGGDAGPVARWHAGAWQVLSPPPGTNKGTMPLGLSVLPPDVAQWPRVEVLMSHAQADGRLVDVLRDIGVQGLVVAATGNGTLHCDLEKALLEAQAAGVAVLRSSRCTEGAVTEHPDDLLPSAGALTPAKARVELLLRWMAAPAIQRPPPA